MVENDVKKWIDCLEEAGGPAFPSKNSMNEKTVYWSGMTLREWFAGQALAGHMAVNPMGFRDEELVAKHCYLMADAMLEARE